MAKKKTEPKKEDIKMVVKPEDVKLNPDADLVVGEVTWSYDDAIIEEGDMDDEEMDTTEDAEVVVDDRPVFEDNLSSFRRKKLIAAWERETGRKY